MRPGSVIVDLAAETGGNCELTEPGETVVRDGVHILGAITCRRRMPLHASQLYARNIGELLELLVKDGELHLDSRTRSSPTTSITHGGEIVHRGAAGRPAMRRA